MPTMLQVLCHALDTDDLISQLSNLARLALLFSFYHWETEARRGRAGIQAPVTVPGPVFFPPQHDALQSTLTPRTPT